ncbi:MAG: hypothetical protein ACP5JG_11775 [Anaerolineae bacterium]
MNPFLVWLERFAELVSLPAAWGIFSMGAIIYVISAWRVRFLALLIQYVFIGLLFARIFDTRPEMALMKILVGWLICGALLLSARIRWRATQGAGQRRQWAANLPFRALALITATVVARLASAKYTLPYVSADLGLACFVLVILAILFFGTEERDPGVVGIGVLNLLAALDIFYSAQDPGLLVTGLLVVVSLLVGLAISYLTVVEVPT